MGPNEVVTKFIAEERVFTSGFFSHLRNARTIVCGLRALIVQLARLSKFFLRKEKRWKRGRKGSTIGKEEIKKGRKTKGKSAVHRGNGIIIVTRVVKGERKAEETKWGFVSEVLTFEERT